MLKAEIFSVKKDRKKNENKKKMYCLVLNVGGGNSFSKTMMSSNKWGTQKQFQRDVDL